MENVIFLAKSAKLYSRIRLHLLFLLNFIQHLLLLFLLLFKAENTATIILN